MKKIFTPLFVLLALLSTDALFAQLAYNTAFTKADFNNSSTKVATSGDVAWVDDQSAIRFKNGTFSWSDQSITIALSPNGVANTISGTFDPDGGTSQEKLTVKSGATLTAITHDCGSISSSGNFSFQLPKDARYVQIIVHGNFNRRVKNLVVSDLSYLNAPASLALDFGAGKINAADSYQSVLIDWCNTAPMTATISGTDASQFAATISNNSAIGSYGTATVNVAYKHNLFGTHTATLTLSNGTTTHVLSLRATTEKKDQFIVWSEEYSADEVALPKNKDVTNAATATSGLSVTYTTSDPNVVAIIDQGAAFRTVNTGTATITATQAGDDNEWNPVSATKTITVSNKRIQSILWTDNLSNLRVGDSPVSLTATVRILSTQNGEDVYTEDATRTAMLSYSSADESVVRVNALTKTLTIVGEGTTTLTASVSGGLFYEAASVSMPVRVRAASALCDAYVLDDAHVVTLNTIDDTTYTISGPADQLVFSANRTKLVGFSGGNLKADAYYNGAWHNIFDREVPLDDYQAFGPISIPQNTTQIKFYTSTGATGYKHVKDVAVSMARYLRTTTPSITIDRSIIGDAIPCSATIQYSNLPDALSISHHCENIVLSDDALSNVCGEYGEQIVSFTVYPTQVGTLYDTLRIADPLTGLSLAIPVCVHTQRNTQTIVWNAIADTLLTTDQISLSATAQTALTYTSSDTTIASIAADNTLTIHRAGVVTITASAAESETFEPATAEKQLVIVRATPTLLAAPALLADTLPYGTLLSDLWLADALADAAGSFHYLAPDSLYRPGNHSATYVFAPENVNWYDSLFFVHDFVVIPLSSSLLSLPSATSLTYGQTLSESVLSGGVANCEGRFAWTTPDTLLCAGEHQVFVSFYPTDSIAYLPTDCALTITVDPAAQTLSWDSYPSILLVGDSVLLSATASSGYPVQYTLDPTALATIVSDTLIALQSGTLTLTASQDGIDSLGFANYLPAEPIVLTIAIQGKGTTTAIDTPVSQRPAARKVVLNGQVLILLEGKTYTLSGQVLKQD